MLSLKNMYLKIKSKNVFYKYFHFHFFPKCKNFCLHIYLDSTINYNKNEIFIKIDNKHKNPVQIYTIWKIPISPCLKHYFAFSEQVDCK